MRTLTPTILCALAAASLPLAPAGAQPIVDDRPAQIRVIFQDDPARAATLSWSTSRGRGNHRVYLDTEPRHGNPAAYRWRIDAQLNGDYDRNGEDVSRDHYHHARVNGLQPDTVYYFVPESDGHVARRERSFRTAPADPDQPFKLLVGGDSRTNGDGQDGRTDRAAMNAVMRELFRTDDTIVALSHGGDYVNSGEYWSQWSAWLDDHTTFTSRPDGRVLPIIPTRGNHEEDEDLYNQVFGFPGADDERGYFTTRIGGFALITLNTEEDIADDDDDDDPARQTRWLRGELERLTDPASPNPVRWLAASYHRPAYPAHKGFDSGIAPTIRDHWVPLFGQFGANLIFESDGHTYKRTLPLLNRERFDRAPDCDSDGDGDEDLGPVDCDDAVTTVERGGVYYVGEGGLGVGLREPSDVRDYLEAGRAREMFHVLLLAVAPDGLTLHTVDRAGCFVDEPGGRVCAQDRFADGPLSVARRTVVPFESTWRFLDDAAELPFGFELPAFDDRFWSEGRGQLGYGDGDEETELDEGPPSVYFRKTIYVDHPVAAAEITALHDDGIAVYVNGQLVGQRYVAAPQVHRTFATEQSDDDEITHFGGVDVAEAFVEGENVIAAVVKQVRPGSSDVSFDLRVTLTAPPPPPPPAEPTPGPEVPAECVTACAARSEGGCATFDLEVCWSACTTELAAGCYYHSTYVACQGSTATRATCGTADTGDGVSLDCNGFEPFLRWFCGFVPF